MKDKLHWSQITDKGLDRLMRDLFHQDWQDNRNKKKEIR